mmetsp:Transcript_10006/g.14987  ORF Transcript_10006/g.14987 Transcript_10006/m.14987 type:complete len:87 (-) Transcript_10006:7-267(-)
MNPGTMWKSPLILLLLVQSIYSLGASDAHQALNSKYETFATGHFSPLPVRAPRARDMNNVHREVDKAIKGASKRIKHSKVPPFDGE